MNHPLRCRCGRLQGHVSPPDMAQRAVCYCKDCQAFAHFLEQPGQVLDEHGGTEIIATLPRHVHITQGLEVLACMSLTERGLLRWYAGCCNTPIGNTPRDVKTSYVGLVHGCLAHRDPSLDDSFGPLRMVLNTKDAKGEVKATPFTAFVTTMKIIASVAWQRVNGKYRRNPFFAEASGTPVKPVRALTAAELARVRAAAAA